MKKYIKPAAAVISLRAENMIAASLGRGGTSDSDKVTEEGQVLSNRRAWGVGLWEEEKE